MLHRPPAISVCYGGKADLIPGELVDRMAKFNRCHELVDCQCSPEHTDFDGFGVLPINGLVSFKIVGCILPVAMRKVFVFGVTTLGSACHLVHHLPVGIKEGLKANSVALLHQPSADVDVQTLRFGAAS